MVLESVVVSILKKYIGKYVKDLDTDNLSISLWNGQATLQNLQLRADALSDFDLPIEVTAGYVGKLSLSIPWNSLYVKPVEIRIEDVFLIAGPLSETPYDEETEKLRNYVTKQNQLAVIAKTDKAKVSRPDSDRKNDTLAEKLVAQIVKNIQVYVSNIHVRYEDQTTCVNVPFSFGITIVGLRAETTDAAWRPAVVDGSCRKVFKVLDLQSLSVYWNTKVKKSSLLHGTPGWKKGMKDLISSNSKAATHEFILYPLSLKLHASLDQDAKVLMELPKITIDVDLKEVSLSLGKRQLELLVDLIDSFEMMVLNQPYRKYKPLQSLAVNRRAWWKYAYVCVAETSYRPWTWARIKKHRSKYREYKDVYRSKLKAVFLEEKEIISALLGSLKKLEMDLDVANIIIARQQAQNEFEAEKPRLIKKQPAANVGWLEWLGVTHKPNGAIRNEDLSDSDDVWKMLSLGALSEEEKQKLFIAIGYTDDTTHPIYSRMYVRSKLQLNLGVCLLSLRNKSKQDVLGVSFTKIQVTLLERPGSQGYDFQTSIMDVCVSGAVSDNQVRHKILHTRCLEPPGSTQNNDALMTFGFSVNPVTISADYSLTLDLAPVNIICNQKTAEAVRDVFTFKDDQRFKEMEAAAADRVHQLSVASRAGLEHAILRDRTTYLKLNLRSPKILLPHGDMMMGQNKVMHLYLGDLSVTTNLRSQLEEQSLRAASESQLEALFYHRTDIKLSDMHLAVSDVSTESDNVGGQCNVDKMELDYVIHPLSLELNINRSLKSGYANFPDFKICASLPSLELEMSKQKVAQLYQAALYFSVAPAATTDDTASEKSDSASSYSQRRRQSGSPLSSDDLKQIQLLLSDGSKRKAKSSEPVPDKDVGTNVADVIGTNTPSQYDADIAKFDRTKVSASFSVHQVSLKYSVEETNRRDTFLILKCYDLVGDVDVHLWDVTARARLGSFVLLDFKHQDSRGDFLRICYSLEDSDLIRVSYTKAEPSGPAFKSKFQQIEQRCCLQFGKLQFGLDEDSLVYIRGEVSSLLDMLESLNSSSGVASGTVHRPLMAIPEDQELDDEAMLVLRAVDSVVTEKTFLMLEFDLKSIGLILTSKRTDIARMSVAGVGGSFCMDQKQTSASVRMQGLSMLDCGDNIKFKKMLSVEADKLADFKIVIRNSTGPGNAVARTSPDIDVNLYVGKIRFTLLFGVLNKLQAWIEAVSSPPARMQTKKVATEILNAQIASAKSAGAKLKFDVRVDAPCIVAPTDALADAFFEMDLGHIVAHNRIFIDECDIVKELISIRVENVQLARFAEDMKNHVISPGSLSASIERNLEQKTGMPSIMEISLDFPQLKVDVREADLEHLVEYAKCNFLSPNARNDVGTGSTPTAHAEDGTTSVSSLGLSNLTTGQDTDNARSGQTPSTTPTPDPASEQMTASNGVVDKREASADQQLRVTVAVGQISFCAYQYVSAALAEKEYLLFLAKTVRLRLDTGQQAMGLQAGLGSVLLTDLQTNDFSGQPVVILSSTQDAKLATLEYHSDIERDAMTAEFSSLKVIADEHCFRQLAAFIARVLDKLSHLFASSAPKEPLSNKNGVVKTFVATASLQRCLVVLQNNMERISSLEVFAFVGHYSQSPDYLNIKARLENLALKDLRSCSSYTDIIKLEGSNLLLFELGIASPRSAEGKAISNLSDGMVKLYVGRVRVVLLYKIFMDMWVVLQPFMNLNKGSSSPNGNEDGTSSSAVDQVNQPAANNLKLILDIDVNAPVILLPEHSKSCTMFVADFGKLKLNNSFLFEEGHSISSSNADGSSTELHLDNVVDKIEALLTDMKLSSGTFDVVSREIQAHDVIRRLGARVTVMRPVATSKPVHVEVRVHPIEVSLSNKALLLVTTIVSSNFGEGAAPTPEPDPHSKSPEISPSPPAKIESRTSRLEVEVSCSSADVRLTSYFEFMKNKTDALHVSDDDDGIPLALMAMKDIRLETSIEASDIELCLLVGLAHVTDERPYRTAGSEVVVERHPNPKPSTHYPARPMHVSYPFSKYGLKESQLVVQYRTASMKLKCRQTVHVSLRHTRSYVNLDFIKELLQFLSQTFSSAEVDKTGSSKGGAGEDHTPESADHKRRLKNDRDELDQESHVQPLLQNVSEPEVTSGKPSASPAGAPMAGAAGVDTVDQLLAAMYNTDSITGFAISCYLCGTDLVLLDNPACQKTTAIVGNVVAWFSYAFDDVMTLTSVDFHRLVLSYGEYPDIQQSARPLLQPCKLDGRYFTWTTGEQYVSVDVGELALSLSPSLLQTILDILNRYGAQIKDEDAKDATPAKPAQHIDWSPQRIQLEGAPKMFDSMQREKTSILKMPGLRRTKSSEQMNIKLDLVRLTLGYDLQGMLVPLCAVQFGASAELTDWTQMLKFNSDITVQAMYFNDENGLWEPLLEPNELAHEFVPYEVNFKAFYCERRSVPFANFEPDVESELLKELLSAQDEVDGADKMTAPTTLNIIVSSDEMMLINITPKALEMFYDLSKAWSVTSLRSQDRTTIVPPLHFRSQLGVPAVIDLHCKLKHVSFAENDQLSVAFSPPLLSATGHRFNSTPSSLSTLSRLRNLSTPDELLRTCNLQDRVDDHEHGYTGLAATSLLKDNVALKVQDFETGRVIQVKDSGTFAYALRKNSEVHQVVTDVKLDCGRRIVTFMSKVQVENLTGAEVYILKMYGSDIASRILLCIPAGGTCGIPLFEAGAEEYQLQLKGHQPCEQSIRLPQDATSALTQAVEVSRMVARCPQVDGHGPDDYVTICTRKKRMLCNGGDVNLWWITVLPMARVSNLLPVGVNFQFEEKSRLSSMYTIDSGKSIEIFTSQVPDDGKIKLQLLGYEGKEWRGSGLYAQTNKKKAKAVRLLLVAEQDEQKQLPVQVVCTMINGVREISLFASYWVINSTSLDLQFQVEDQCPVLLKASEVPEPKLAIHSKKSNAKAHIFIVPNSQSQSFAMDATGTDCYVTCKDANGVLYMVHVSIQISSTALTRLILLSPRYLVSNHTKDRYQFALEGHDNAWHKIAPGECLPVWLQSSSQAVLIKEFSPEARALEPVVPFNKVQKFAKRLSNDTTICIDVEHMGERRLMNIADYSSGCMPARVDNYCSRSSIYIHQKVNCSSDELSEVAPNHSVFFTWRMLSLPKLLCASLSNSADSHSAVDVSKDGVGRLGQTKAKVRRPRRHRLLSGCFPGCCSAPSSHDVGESRALLANEPEANHGRVVYWITYLDGVQRVVAFSEDPVLIRYLYKKCSYQDLVYDVYLSLRGVGLSLVNDTPSEILYASLTGALAVWEVEVKRKSWKVIDADASTLIEDAWKNSVATVNTDKLKVNIETMYMTAPYKGTLRRSSQPGVWVQYSQAKTDACLHVMIHRLQVDNQQYDVTFPCVLYPTPLPARVVNRNGRKPFIEMTLVYSSVCETMIIKYLKLLVQEMSLKIDRDLLTGLLTFYRKDMKAASVLILFAEDQLFARTPVADYVNKLLETKSSTLQLQYLHLSPLKVCASFSPESKTDGGPDLKADAELVELLIGTVGIHFTEFSDVEIRLGYFERRNAVVTSEILLADVQKHYTLQAVKQFHVLVFGLDVLGNPVGLMRELETGFKDLFYEPYLGSVDGPDQFAAGLVYGVRSLLGHTIGGTAGAASLITEQLGQVLASLTFDSEYKRRRRRQMRGELTGLRDGLALGGKQFVMGIVFGLSGVFVRPIQGAREDGVEGFFKGLGKGMLGLLVKPTGGVIDMVSSSLEGVRRFAEVSGEDLIGRIRLPRLTYPKQALEPYSLKKAYGYGILKSLSSRFKSFDGLYKDHLAIEGSQHLTTIIIFTTSMVLNAYQRSFFGDWAIQWEYKYHQIVDVERSDTSVRIHVQAAGGRTYEDVTCSKPEGIVTLFDLTKKYLDEYAGHEGAGGSAELRSGALLTDEA